MGWICLINLYMYTPYAYLDTCNTPIIFFYIYTYMYMYVYMHMYVSIWIDLEVHIYIYMYIPPSSKGYPFLTSFGKGAFAKSEAEFHW